MEESHKDTDTKEIVERPVKKQKYTFHMEQKMLILVLIRLVNGEFENKNVFGLIDVEVDDPDNHFNAPGKNLLYKLIQPEIVGMAAGVCKAWYTQVEKHRILALLEAVDYAHNYMIEKALELTYIDTYVPYPEGNPETIPPETYMRIEVHFGFRKMYAIEVVRSMIKPGDDGVPVKLNVQSSMPRSPMAPITGDIPQWKSKYRLPLHRLCWVPTKCRERSEDAELQDFKDWQQTANATLCSWLECWQCVAKCRLSFRLNCPTMKTTTKLF
ncbi:MAG: hypothetical protein WCJ33_02645 [Pseudomonadota bacterium]